MRLIKRVMKLQSIIFKRPNSKGRSNVWRFVCVALTIVLSGCSVDRVFEGDPLDDRAAWALLPVVNQAQTPQAGERVESILLSLLRNRGVKRIGHYPKQVKNESLMLMDDQARYASALTWALKQGYRYGITGTVEEWRYKAGLDGEPAVGITLRVVDLQLLAKRSNEANEPIIDPVLWSATGARTGWGREGVAIAAHKLLNELLDGLTFVEHVE